MPRLHIWAAMGSVTSALSYGLYEYVYLPWQTTKRDMELFVEAEKSRLSVIAQRLFLLQQQSSSPLSTNASKVEWYTALAQLRREVLQLPLALQTEREASAMLDAIDACERSVCTPLQFRPLPLTMWEACRCLFAFCVFVIQFRVMIPLLKVWGASELTDRYARSQTARWLLNDVLEVDTEMHVHASLLSVRNDPHQSAALRKSLLDVTSEELKCAACVDSAVRTPSGKEQELGITGTPRPVTIVFTPSCWVEELSFWAARNNPLLQVQLQYPPAAAEEDGVPLARTTQPSAVTLVYPQTPCIGYSDTTDGRHTYTEGDKKKLLTEPTTAQYQRWSHLNERTFPELSVALGYPLAIAEERGSALEGSHEQEVAMCCATGTPRVVYLGPELAGADKPYKAAKKEAVQTLLHNQFGDGASSAVSSASHGTPPSVALRDAGLSPAMHHIPLFTKTNSLNVYGGSGRQRPTITLAVGPAVGHHDCWSQWLSLHQQLNFGERLLQ